MTPFEATHKETETLKLGGKRCTPKAKLAYLINASWLYSEHWEKENYQWIEQAKEDLNQELLNLYDRERELLKAKVILNSIKWNNDETTN